MTRNRSSLLIGVLALASALALPASAQYNPDWHRWGWQDRDRDRDQDRDRDRDRRSNGRESSSSAYNEGYRAGQADRNANRPGRGFKDRRYHNDADQRAYDAGYNDGYNAASGQGTYGRGPWGRRGGWETGQSGYGRGGTVASQYGYRDGMNAAQADLQRGNGYHPTDGNNYQHGDRGYNSSFGDKRTYINEYRQAYRAGYDQVYYGNSGRRRY